MAILPQVDPDDPYRFIDANAAGAPFFACGWYPGLQSLLLEPGDWYLELLDDLLAADVNYLRVCLTFGMGLDQYDWLHPYVRGSAEAGTTCQPSNVPGWQPQGLFDLETYDPSFFSFWDSVLGAAGERGIVVQACLLDGVHTRNMCEVNVRTQVTSAQPPCESCGECNGAAGAAVWSPFEVMGLFYDYYFGANNQQGLTVCNSADWYATGGPVFERQSDYVKTTVGRLMDHDNLIWEVINEGQAAQNDGWLDRMVELIRSVDDRHLIMPADLPGHQFVAGQFVPSGHLNSNSTSCLQSNNEGFPSVHQCLLWNRGEVLDEPGCPGEPAYQQPLISDNDFSVCPGSPLSRLPQIQRQKAWTVLTGGGYSSLFVFNITTGDPVLTLGNQYVQRGMEQVGRVATFINGVFGGAQRLVGSRPLAENLADQEGWVWALLDSQGRPMVVYFLISGSATVPGAASAETATWFDPVTGMTHDAGISLRYQTPSDQDWVLFFDY